MSVLELKEEVSRLSKAEQLQAMEWLWASLSKKPEEVESPDGMGKCLLRARLKRIRVKRSFSVSTSSKNACAVEASYHSRRCCQRY